MKKVLGVLLIGILMVSLTGCGNSKKVLTCVTKYDDGYVKWTEDDDFDGEYNEVVTLSYTFWYDKTGEKLESMTVSRKEELEEALSETDINKYNDFCKKYNSYSGVSCTFNNSKDKKVAEYSMNFIYAKLDQNGYEMLEEESLDEIHNYNLDYVKKELESEKYACKLK